MDAAQGVAVMVLNGAELCVVVAVGCCFAMGYGVMGCDQQEFRLECYGGCEMTV